MTLRVLSAAILGSALAVAGLNDAPAQQYDPPPPAQPPAVQTPAQPLPSTQPGVEVLARGPVHEAFAQPYAADAAPTPAVSKAPPAPVQELPPTEKPDGANVQWIPGYWSWDNERQDFVWVSGVWRAVPPGREWRPGQWVQQADGYHWVHGY